MAESTSTQIRARPRGSGGLGGILSSFMEILSPPPSTAVGLSIGTSSIKLVELKRTGKTWKLLHFGIVQLPEDAVVNREIINQITVVDSIKTLVSQIKLKNKSVCTSLSGTSLIVKKMTVEITSKKEIQDQVFWEAEQYLPFDVQEVVMDYDVLGEPKDHKVDVMLVAVKGSVLESYIVCVEDAGLRAKLVDVDYFAMQNVFEANYPIRSTESAAIVDIGASSLKIVIVHNGVPVFTKDSSIGGKNLTAEIQKNLNLSYFDAETLKISGQGGAMPQEVGELIHIMCENFATEVKRAVDFYNASSSGAPVAYILLTGGSSRLPNLPRIVEERVGLPTQIMNPFNAITYDPSVFTADYLNSIAPIAAIPIGLALRMGTK